MQHLCIFHNFLRFRCISAELAETAKAYKAELDRLVVEQIALIQQEINGEMKRINDVIYSGRKTAPTLTINDASHYVFFTPRDGGTGTQYKGLVVFDLAMLSLTRLPVIRFRQTPFLICLPTFYENPLWPRFVANPPLGKSGEAKLWMKSIRCIR